MKFEYPSIERVTINGTRFYDTPVGQSPSVTTILSHSKDMEPIERWREWVGHKVAQEITEESSDIGSLMHEQLERYLLSGDLKPFKTMYERKAFIMAKTIIKHGLSRLNEIWGVEARLYHDILYSGTTDLVGVLDGTEAIIDFKNTRKPKKEKYIDDYFCQLVAYADAHNYMFGTNIKTGYIFMMAKDYPHFNTYQEFKLDGPRWDKYKDMWYKRVSLFYDDYLKK